MSPHEAFSKIIPTVQSSVTMYHELTQACFGDMITDLDLLLHLLVKIDALHFWVLLSWALWTDIQEG